MKRRASLEGLLNHDLVREAESTIHIHVCDDEGRDAKHIPEVRKHILRSYASDIQGAVYSSIRNTLVFHEPPRGTLPYIGTIEYEHGQLKFTPEGTLRETHERAKSDFLRVNDQQHAIRAIQNMEQVHSPMQGDYNAMIDVLHALWDLLPLAPVKELARVANYKGQEPKKRDISALARPLSTIAMPSYGVALTYILQRDQQFSQYDDFTLYVQPENTVSCEFGPLFQGRIEFNRKNLRHKMKV